MAETLPIGTVTLNSKFYLYSAGEFIDFPLDGISLILFITSVTFITYVKEKE